ncbi:hypothetical protein KKH05_00045 [Patescibacteria group bacterium]|nr:hypothetical protein [Patescibacteria group bacterium]
MSFQDVVDVLVASFQQLWIDFIGFLPTFISALVVFIVGLIVAAAVGQLIERVVGALKLDSLLAKAGAESHFRRAGLKLNVGRFLGRLTYWFVLVAFFLAASDILGFFTLSSFLQAVLLYIPQVVVAVLILLATTIIASFLRGVITASARSGGLTSANFAGAITWWAIVLFGVSAALIQLGIASALVQAFITAVFAMVALAGGIAFGLGGKGYAEHLLKKFREQVEHK